MQYFVPSMKERVLKNTQVANSLKAKIPLLYTCTKIFDKVKFINFA